MLPARTYSVSIDHEWRSLYDRIWRPEFFTRWASGLTESDLRQDGDDWFADGPEGPVRIRFTGHNDFGIMDHFVDVGDRSEEPTSELQSLMRISYAVLCLKK